MTGIVIYYTRNILFIPLTVLFRNDKQLVKCGKNKVGIQIVIRCFHFNGG